MDLGLSGKVFMVGGASRGLGYAIAQHLFEEGACVSISSSSEENSRAAAARIDPTGERAFGMRCDVSKRSDIDDWTAASVERFGGLDGVLVNGAGPRPGQFGDFDDDDWQQAFELILMSAVRLCRSTLPHLEKRGSGSIVMLTSSSVREPMEVLLLSNVMRSGVTSLAKSLATPYASKKIRINTVVPGRIDTERMKNLDALVAANTNTPEDKIREAGERAIPSGRYGTPAEFARAAVFLLSPAASYITGSTLIVDGGSMKSI